MTYRYRKEKQADTLITSSISNQEKLKSKRILLESKLIFKFSFIKFWYSAIKQGNLKKLDEYLQRKPISFVKSKQVPAYWEQVFYVFRPPLLKGFFLNFKMLFLNKQNSSCSLIFIPMKICFQILYKDSQQKLFPSFFNHNCLWKWFSINFSPQIGALFLSVLIKTATVTGV